MGDRSISLENQVYLTVARMSEAQRAKARALVECGLDVAVACLRALEPQARSERLWGYYGSSASVRRARCALCRATIATCSAKWKPTKTFMAAVEAHVPACREEYLRGLCAEKNGS